MIKELRPVFIAVIRFFVIYLGMMLLYQVYLDLYAHLPIDPLTRSIANQVVRIQNMIGYETYLVDGIKTKGSYFYTNGKWTAVMIEGCNAFSVMVLFSSFIFVFYRGICTFWFVSIGLLVLHILNIFRITLLNIIAVDYERYMLISHDYLFPIIIYGGKVVLWLIWIKFFVLKK